MNEGKQASSGSRKMNLMAVAKHFLFDHGVHPFSVLVWMSLVAAFLSILGIHIDLDRSRIYDAQHTTSMETFRRRRQHFVEMCHRLGHEGEDDELFDLLHFENLAVCLPPKTGSTPFKMIIYYLLHQTNMFFDTFYRNVHYDIPTEMYHHRSRLGKETVTAVFAREPYSRLFSAYVDKLFKPRADNWRKYGKLIVNHVRGPYESAIGLICACDVTFAEFVRYVIMVEQGTNKSLKSNPHFYPMHRQCGLCNKPENHSVVYDFIGKTESFAADTLAILKAVGLYERMPADFDLTVSVPRWSIQMLLNFTFTKHFLHPTTNSCMSKLEALRRLWRFFHIRGLISTSELFPLSESEADEATYESFLQLAYAAFERSRKDPNLAANKMAAMKEAYSTVPLLQRKALREIFSRDFLLFDYPSAIPEVFPKNDHFELGRFRYFDVFDRHNRKL